MSKFITVNVETKESSVNPKPSILGGETLLNIEHIVGISAISPNKTRILLSNGEVLHTSDMFGFIKNQICGQ